MNIISMLTKKRNKGKLTKEEMEYFVKEYNKGSIEDYQATGLVMAMCINGLDKEEIKDLTVAMAESGEMIDMSDVSENYIEKHSIGGVGDKVSLILLPILAALDIPAGKLSGKGIGICGSTADKLSAIPGCRANITIEEYKDNLKENKISITSNLLDLAPAEKQLYDLRRKIECIDNLNLIAASIMSRKMASGGKKLLLNIQCGYGSSIKNYRDGRELARMIIDSGKLAGKEVRCVLSKIYEPLGKTIGNSLEIIEVIEALKGNFEKDVKELVEALGCQALIMAEKAKDVKSAEKMIREAISSGKALAKFKELIEIQNGDSSCIDDISLLGEAKYKVEVKSPVSGYVQMLDASRIGNIAVYLGAGRKMADDEIDYTAGIVLEKKMDDFVKKGETLAYIYSNDEEKINGASKNIIEAYTLGRKMFSKGSSVLGIMTK